MSIEQLRKEYQEVIYFTCKCGYLGSELCNCEEIIDTREKKEI